MTIFSLGWNSVRRNFGNYISYFVSILASVFILITFYCIYYNDHIQAFRCGRVKIFIIFQIAACIVILFSAIFIWYSNRFFIKNMKKEVAIYSLVGMKKKEIGTLMFFENIILGVFALLIGVPAGVGTSNLFVKLYQDCIKSAVPIENHFDIRAVIKTVLVFALIFGFNAYQAYRVIYRYRLIELLHAQKEGDRQPSFSMGVAICSLAMVLIGYVVIWKMDMNAGATPTMILAFVVMCLEIVGIYLFFNHFIIYAMRLIKRKKKLYYKGENLIGVSQIVYRIKGNSNLLATIAVISSAAIIALCFTFSCNAILDEIIPAGSPFSLMYESGDKKLDKRVESAIRNNGENKIDYKNNLVLVNGTGLTKKYSGPFDAKTKDPFRFYTMSLSEYQMIMKESYFNKSTDINTRATDLRIPKQEDCFFIEVSNLGEGRGRLAGETLNASFDGTDTTFHISDSDIKCVTGIHFQRTVIVVQDSTFEQLVKNYPDQITTIRVYNFNNPLKNIEIIKRVHQVIPTGTTMNSFYDEFIELHNLYGSFIFVGIFLSILFVISTGSIMYYKQLMEASEDKERYQTLYRIGFNRKESFHVILKQIGAIFGLPMVFAIVNSLIAMKAWVKYASNGGDSSPYQIKCIAIMMGVYVAIYVCFYFLSVHSYQKIVRYQHA